MNLCLFFWFLLASFAKANTETYQFHVPKDFPHLGDAYVPTIPYISLWNTTFNTLSLNVSPSNTSVVEVVGLHPNEKYAVKVCWTAADPISINSIRHHIIPHDTEFEGTVVDQTRVVLLVETEAFSYPVLSDDVKIDISIASVKLGIPVDLYSIVIYLALVVLGSVFVLSRIDIHKILDMCREDKLTSDKSS